MPKFSTITKTEAMLKTSYAKSAEHLKSYIEKINSLADHEAMKIEAAAGETVRQVRVRLGKAAKLAGRELHIKRVGNELYAWTRKRRGRKPGSTNKQVGKK